MSICRRRPVPDAVAKGSGPGPLAIGIGQDLGKDAAERRFVAWRNQTTSRPIDVNHLDVRWDAAHDHRCGDSGRLKEGEREALKQGRKHKGGRIRV